MSQCVRIIYVHEYVYINRSVRLVVGLSIKACLQQTRYEVIYIYTYIYIPHHMMLLSLGIAKSATSAFFVWLGSNYHSIGLWEWYVLFWLGISNWYSYLHSEELTLYSIMLPIHYPTVSTVGMLLYNHSVSYTQLDSMCVRVCVCVFVKTYSSNPFLKKCYLLVTCHWTPGPMFVSFSPMKCLSVDNVFLLFMLLSSFGLLFLYFYFIFFNFNFYLYVYFLSLSFWIAQL